MLEGIEVFGILPQPKNTGKFTGIDQIHKKNRYIERSRLRKSWFHISFRRGEVIAPPPLQQNLSTIMQQFDALVQKWSVLNHIDRWDNSNNRHRLRFGNPSFGILEGA